MIVSSGHKRFPLKIECTSKSFGHHHSAATSIITTHKTVYQITITVGASKTTVSNKCNNLNQMNLQFPPLRSNMRLVTYVCQHVITFPSCVLSFLSYTHAQHVRHLPLYSHRRMKCAKRHGNRNSTHRLSFRVISTLSVHFHVFLDVFFSNSSVRSCTWVTKVSLVTVLHQ